MAASKPDEFTRMFYVWEFQYLARHAPFAAAMVEWEEACTRFISTYGARTGDCGNVLFDIQEAATRGEIALTKEHAEEIERLVELSYSLFDSYGYYLGERYEKLIALDVIELIDSGIDFSRPEDGAVYTCDGEYDTMINGMIPGIAIKIDYNAPIKSILAEVESAVVAARRYQKGDRKYSPCLEGVSAYYLCASRGQFSPTSNRARAAGLWLWDRVQEIGEAPGATAQAIREFRASSDIRTIGLENAEDSDLRFYHNRTTECVKTPGVLSFSKKGTRISRRVPGARKGR